MLRAGTLNRTVDLNATSKRTANPFPLPAFDATNR